MVAIKSLFVPAFIFFQGALSYCIYNNLQDSGMVEIQQENNKISSFRKFHAIINSGTKKCCPYSTKDCAPSQLRTDNATFTVSFLWKAYKSREYKIHCLTGGALFFNGTKEDRRGYCLDEKDNMNSLYVFTDE